MANNKKISLIDNGAGGIDLLVERDAGNEVRILTGYREHSKRFWRQMRLAADKALLKLE